MPYTAKNVFSYNEGLVRALFGLLVVVEGLVFCCGFISVNWGLFETLDGGSGVAVLLLGSHNCMRANLC